MADSSRSDQRSDVVGTARDQAASRFFDMPRAAIRTGCVDLVLPVGEVGPVLDWIVREGG